MDTRKRAAVWRLDLLKASTHPNVWIYIEPFEGRRVATGSLSFPAQPPVRGGPEEEDQRGWESCEEEEPANACSHGWGFAQEGLRSCCQFLG